jgi:hypothetical protein
MLAVMSTGPVGFSDAFNRTNYTLLAHAADSAGVVLKPSKPVTSIDSTLGPAPPKGHVLGSYDAGATSSRILAWYFVSHQLKTEYGVRVSDFYPELMGAKRTVAVREWHTACRNGSFVPGLPSVGGIHAGAAESMVPDPCAHIVVVDPTQLDSTVVTAGAAAAGDEFYAPQLHSVMPVCGGGSRWVVLGTLSTYATLSKVV